ncbi:hypothetical protein D7V82_14685 [bacterium 1xD8-6]|nr:hypothetical protein D7V72_15945 [bacterium D16-36]RKI66560.1 hypothetical protein D7V82_14685 [bacterium 1xD8-6]
MIDVSLEFDIGDVEKQLGAMKNKASLVMARAANRSIVTGKKVLKAETAKKYLVREKDVEAILHVERAARNKPFVKLVYKDEHQNLFRWNERSGKVAVSPGRAISYKKGRPNPRIYKGRMFRSQSLQKLGGDRKPFVQISKSTGELALFRRKNNESKELVGVGAAALPQEIANPEVMRRFEKEAAETLQKRLVHEIDQELKKG